MRIILSASEDLQFRQKSRRSSSPPFDSFHDEYTSSSHSQGHAIFWRTKREGTGTRMRRCVEVGNRITRGGRGVKLGIGAAGPDRGVPTSGPNNIAWCEGTV